MAINVLILFQINVTLHESFTTNDVVDCCGASVGGNIHFTKQTFDCTWEAAKELKTRLELLILVRASEHQVLSLPEFARVGPNYGAWIDGGNFEPHDRDYLKCVANCI